MWFSNFWIFDPVQCLDRSWTTVGKQNFKNKKKFEKIASKNKSGGGDTPAQGGVHRGLQVGAHVPQPGHRRGAVPRRGEGEPRGGLGPAGQPLWPWMAVWQVPMGGGVECVRARLRVCVWVCFVRVMLCVV